MNNIGSQESSQASAQAIMETQLAITSSEREALNQVLVFAGRDPDDVRALTDQAAQAEGENITNDLLAAFDDAQNARRREKGKDVLGKPY